MATGKAYYWLVLGTLVLGLGSEYQRGGLQPLHRLADRSTLATNCLLVRAARDYIVIAKLLVGEAPAKDSRQEWKPELPLRSHNFAHLNAELALRQADLARLGVDRTDMIDLAHELAARQQELACLQSERARIVALARSLHKTRGLEERRVHGAISADADDIADLDVGDEN